MSDLDATLAEIALQYDDLQAQLSRPETSTDPNLIRKLGKELARLEPTVVAYRRLEAIGNVDQQRVHGAPSRLR